MKVKKESDHHSENSSEDKVQASSVGWHFDNSYARLPEYFFAKLAPVSVQKPDIVILNHALANSLGLNFDAISNAEAARVFSGNMLPEGAEPIAQAYSGHQFGHFTMLGDGRAILLGELITPEGSRFDLQLKGSGQTPFSRRGDGRAALAPMLREYIISEAMYALGIPTTRSLAVVTTGENVRRETLLPGAILTRIAASHIRVGTFEYAARQSDSVATKILADYTIQRHFPDLIETDNRYLCLLNRIIERQAELVTKWLLVGFIHGVMNTDNMSVCGETIDYGPCAFMDAYDPNTVFSSIDQYGRCRYSHQPMMAQWNLARLAETLLPLIDPVQEKALELAGDAIDGFPQIYQSYWMSGMHKKLGLFTEEAQDNELFTALLTWMQHHYADYTNTFRALSVETLPNDTLFEDAEFKAWYGRWQARLARQGYAKSESLELMRTNNPAIIPRNHRVEEALLAASEHSDYTVLHKLLSAISKPYDALAQFNDYHSPPLSSERVYQTFCGT